MDNNNYTKYKNRQNNIKNQLLPPAFYHVCYYLLCRENLLYCWIIDIIHFIHGVFYNIRNIQIFYLSV